ncbi:MAG: hypothetical protein WBC92_10090 [Terracidiphilus sp.]
MGSVADNPAWEVLENLPSVDERRALIERVAACEQFTRSARLRSFLLYVGRQSLKEGCPEIHEQEIGAKVFGRPDSYDRTSDNIVRVNATELRKRIESYFATTGAAEPLIFDIPRGSYKPVFHRRLIEVPNHQATTVESSHAVQPEPAIETSDRIRPQFVAQLIWALVSLAFAIASSVLFIQNRSMRAALHPWENQPAVAAFWSGFLDSHLPTDVVLPDDSASVVEDITHDPITLGDYLSRGFERQIQSSSMSADRKEDVYEILNHNLVTFGAVRAVQLVLGEIPSTDSHFLAFSRNFSADEVKRNNVVLIGGQKAVPWDYLFDNQLSFVTDYDYAHSQQIVRNRNPKQGEQSIYTVPGGAGDLIGYATIAYLPNPSRTGHVIILAGTDSDATGAAAAFLTSEDQMERLRNTFRAKNFPYFEVLLKTSRVSGTFFDAECIAYRTYPDLH